VCVCRTLEAVTPSTLVHFRHLAEKLIAEKDMVELLSAALAVVSGNADIKQRSLLSSREVLINRTSSGGCDGTSDGGGSRRSST